MKLQYALRITLPSQPDANAHPASHPRESLHDERGNIIALQQILGHASIQQTMVYAHLSPDYLQNAIALNPIAGAVSTLRPHSGIFEMAQAGSSFLQKAVLNRGLL